MLLATRGQLNPRPCSLLYGEGPVGNSAGILQSWDSCCTLEVQEADRKRGHPGAGRSALPPVTLGRTVSL